MDDINSHDIFDDSQYVNDADQAIIKVIGVGGGGSNAINYMYEQNIANVNYVVCNTDLQHLRNCKVPNKLLIGYELTKGLGAGNDPEVGRKCAEASEDDIRKLFDDNTEMVFITAGMGGGTGTGSAPVVARLAKEAGLLTIGIVTIPFMFEGQKKFIKAHDGAEEMEKYVDALLMINNENLVDLYKDYDLINAFKKVDDTLANAARSISEIISEPAFINVDFQDVKTILKDSGTAIIATAFGEGEHRISDAIHNALHSPLLKIHDIYTAKRLLFKFSYWRESENPIKTEEINEITQFTSQLPPSIDVKWGIADNPELGDRVKITVLASGFHVTLREDTSTNGGAGQVKKVSFGGLGSRSEKPTKEHSKEDIYTRMAEVYGADKVSKQRRNAAKIKYAVLKPSQFDDHEVISMIEQTPTFNRDAHFNERLQKVSESISEPETDNTTSANSQTISFDFGSED